MMWVDKYCPRHLEDLSCTPAVTRLLERIANKGDIPHLLMYGPMGAGKKTRILALLRKLYGDGIDKIKSETIKPENVSDEFVTIASAYHNQVSAPELGTKDRVCCQYMIKQLSAVSSAFSFGKTDKPKYREIFYCMGVKPIFWDIFVSLELRYFYLSVVSCLSVSCLLYLPVVRGCQHRLSYCWC
eukprot:GHVN01040359.1.p2 GENE.GHVN01040359.1~~GHVN01040359.1.p2  ORF type:complete len:185 (+),score=19.04 GHVN01040359.1:83-637(+)